MEHAMELSEFTFKLLLLFFPGILCAYLVDQLTTHRPRETFFFLLQSFVYGIFSYFICWAGLSIVNYLRPGTVNANITFLRALIKSNEVFSFKEIAVTCIIAIILAGLVSISSRYKLLNKAAHLIGITKKFGELDVWGYMLNMEEVVWVTVRDHKNNLIYDGWVQAFSDDSKDAELLLRDVSVYKNSTAERLYQIGVVYLSRNREDISIECRTLPIDERVQWKEVSAHETRSKATTDTKASQ
jgi:hypothetical protein